MFNKVVFISLLLNFRKMDVKRFCRYMEMKEEDRRRSWDIFGSENENDFW